MSKIQKMTETEVRSGLKERGISVDLRISEEYKDPVRTPGVIGISQTKTGFMVYMVSDYGTLYNTSVHPDRDTANSRVFERAVAASEKKQMQDHRIRTIPNDQVQGVSNPAYTGWTRQNMYQQDDSGDRGRRYTNSMGQTSYRRYGEYVPSDRGEYKPLDRDISLYKQTRRHRAYAGLTGENINRLIGDIGLCIWTRQYRICMSLISGNRKATNQNM